MMLSDFLRFDVVDAAGESARLLDLAVDLSAGDYPPVTHLLVQGQAGKPEWLGWQAVETTDWRARQIRVTDLRAREAVPEELLRQSVLLKRDLLDELVLDLENHHATLANDLWLHEENGCLSVRAADPSPWAMLRRLSRGRLGGGRIQNLLDWKHVEFLRGDPQGALIHGDYHSRIGRLPPAQIAHLTDAVPYLHAAELLTLIEEQVAADALEIMLPERRVQIFEELDADMAVRILGLMAVDAAADLLGHLSPGLARRYLEALPASRSRLLVELLRYPENTAGGIMTNEVVIVPRALPVGEARRAVRDLIRTPDFVYYLYVVEDEETRRLCGVVTLRTLLVADEMERLEDVMRTELVTIDPLQQATIAAQRVVDTSLAALPVVASDGRLLGLITADAAVAQLAPWTWRTQAPRVFS